MILTVNGKKETVNIGCRSFISLYELLHRLDVPGGVALNIQVNKSRVEQSDFMLHMVSSGDNLTIKYS